MEGGSVVQGEPRAEGDAKRHLRQLFKYDPHKRRKTYGDGRVTLQSLKLQEYGSIDLPATAYTPITTFSPSTWQQMTNRPKSKARQQPPGAKQSSRKSTRTPAAGGRSSNAQQLQAMTLEVVTLTQAQHARY